MAKTKTPNYDEMSLDELNAASREHYEAIRTKGEQRSDELTPVKKLELELDIATHRAHLAVINPLRTELGAREELERSDFARRAKGMTKAEWDRLRQVIAIDEVAGEAEVHEPSAEG